jgi:hypothetical protein
MTGEFRPAQKNFNSLPYELRQQLIKEGKAPVEFNIDEVVSLFLYEHDVIIQRPNKRPGVETSDGLLYAVVGPLAFANAAIKNQSKAAALAEWTTWKQWALSHADFNQFKQNTQAKIEQININFVTWFHSKDGKERIFQFIAKQEAENKKETIMLLIIIASLLVLFILIFLILFLISRA